MGWPELHSLNSAHPGLSAVASREVAWILRDRVARFLLIRRADHRLRPCLASPSAPRLCVALRLVVDRDDSATSSQFVQTLAAVPGIAVASRAE